MHCERRSREQCQDADVIIISHLGPADDQPALRHGIPRRKGGRKRVVVAAGEEERVRVRAARRGNCLQWLGHLEGILPQINNHVRGLGHMSKISEQAVGDVDHGRSAGPCGNCAGTIANLRHPLRLHKYPR
jgi:hypothetical protein